MNDLQYNLVIRENVKSSLNEVISDIVDCILNQGCTFWDNRDESADQIAECMFKHVDYSRWTGDEFEYACQLINYCCAMKLAFIQLIGVEE